MQDRDKVQERDLRILLFVNCVCFVAHIYNENADLFYFFQLTVIGETLVILNFYFSLMAHRNKPTLQLQLHLSRLHSLTLALEFIIVVGFWALKIFFPIGINVQGEQFTIVTHFLSVYMHGGSFLTMFYFVRKDQILTETVKTRKIVSHLCFWALPFAGLQVLKWYLTGNHIYGFIKHFTQLQLVVFELTLFSIAVYVDYFINVRHGFKILKEKQKRQSERFIEMPKES